MVLSVQCGTGGVWGTSAAAAQSSLEGRGEGSSGGSAAGAAEALATGAAELVLAAAVGAEGLACLRALVVEVVDASVDGSGLRSLPQPNKADTVKRTPQVLICG